MVSEPNVIYISNINNGKFPCINVQFFSFEYDVIGFCQRKNVEYTTHNNFHFMGYKAIKQTIFITYLMETVMNMFL